MGSSSILQLPNHEEKRLIRRQPNDLGRPNNRHTHDTVRLANDVRTALFHIGGNEMNLHNYLELNFWWDVITAIIGFTALAIWLIYNWWHDR